MYKFLNKGRMVVATLLALSAIGVSFPAFAGRETGNGADAFDLTTDGQGIQFFDFMEFGDAFDPKKLPEYSHIEQQLRVLRAKAPRIARDIEKTIGAVNWSFVVPPLKDVPTTGETNLVITHKKIQAAVSVPEKLTVQINRGVWDSLPEKSRAYLLVHELVWIMEKSPLLYQEANPRIQFVDLDLNREHPWAEGDRYRNLRFFLNKSDLIVSSEGVRRLTGFLMNPTLGEESITGENIYQFVRESAGKVNQRTRFVNRIGFATVTDSNKAFYTLNKDALVTYDLIKPENVPSAGWVFADADWEDQHYDSKSVAIDSSSWEARRYGLLYESYRARASLVYLRTTPHTAIGRSAEAGLEEIERNRKLTQEGKTMLSDTVFAGIREAYRRASPITKDSLRHNAAYTCIFRGGDMVAGGTDIGALVEKRDDDIVFENSVRFRFVEDGEPRNLMGEYHYQLETIGNTLGTTYIQSINSYYGGDRNATFTVYARMDSSGKRLIFEFVSKGRPTVPALTAGVDKELGAEFYMACRQKP